jgi:hypothetical protein
MTSTKTSAIFCTAHTPTAEQGVGFDTFTELKTVAPELHAKLVNCPSDVKSLNALATELVCGVLPHYTHAVLPIGSPAFQMVLAQHLARAVGSIEVPVILFSDTARVSEDAVQADGSVKKISVFKHRGYVEVPVL